jgi:hypothetical protein
VSGRQYYRLLGAVHTTSSAGGFDFTFLLKKTLFTLIFAGIHARLLFHGMPT